MLIETKTRTLFKMLKMALLNCSINEKCCWMQLELTDALRLVNIHFIAYPKAKGNVEPQHIILYLIFLILLTKKEQH